MKRYAWLVIGYHCHFYGMTMPGHHHTLRSHAFWRSNVHCFIWEESSSPRPPLSASRAMASRISQRRMESHYRDDEAFLCVATYSSICLVVVKFVQSKPLILSKLVINLINKVNVDRSSLDNHPSLVVMSE